MSTSITLGTQLKENIKSRYLLTDQPYKGFMDITIPHQLHENIELGGKYIAPNLAMLGDGEAIPFKEFLKLQGITKAQLTELTAVLNRLKERQIVLVSLGYGGISSNVLHFMDLLCKETGVTNIFKRLAIYEEDTITLMNILRMYKDTSTTLCEPGIANKLNGFNEKHLCTPENLFLQDFMFIKEHYDEVKDREDVRYFGACDFDTRKFLEDAPFYFTGHSGNDVSIIVRPQVNTELMVETYGQINLATFFSNVLALTIELFVQLSNDTQATVESDTITWEHTGEFNA
jgi:hypothetical protein